MKDILHMHTVCICTTTVNACDVLLFILLAIAESLVNSALAQAICFWNWTNWTVEQFSDAKASL